jgi:ketosteroid isomerase-like protein
VGASLRILVGQRRAVATKSCDLVEELERDWRDALRTRDMDRLRQLLHPDFVLIGSRSTGPFMMGRDEWLDAIQRREVETIELQVRDATMLDQVMIGTVHARWRLKYLGRVIEDCVLLTDVWVRDEGQWRAIRRHSTPAPAGTCDNLRGE